MRLLRPIHIPLILLGALALLGMAAGAKSPAKISDTDRLKATYLFMEANSRMQQEDFGAAYYMLRHAAELAPDDPHISGALAEYTIYTGLGDSAEFEDAYSKLRQRYEADPKDFQNGLKFVRVAQQLRRERDVRDVYAQLYKSFPNRSEYAVEYAWARALDYLRGDSAAVDEALGIYDKLEEGIGIDPTITLNRVRALSISRDTAAIVAAIEKYARSAPADPEANLISGRLFEGTGMPDSAIYYYNRACELDSTFGEAYLARADYYLLKGDSTRYDEEVTKVLESPTLDFPPKMQILTDYTRALFQIPERRGAINLLFTKMMDIHPGEAELHNLYGSFMAAQDSFALAAEQFGYAMDLDPDNPDFPRFRMQTALQAGDTVQAINTTLEASKRLQDIDFPIWGSALLSMGKRNKEALEALDAYRVSGDERPEAISSYYQQRGDILYNLEEVDSALVNYETALTFNPKNAGALNNLAYFMTLEKRDLDRARQYIEKALIEEPLNPTYIDTYAWVLFQQGDYPAAKREIDQVLSIYATDDSSGIVVADTALIPDKEVEIVDQSLARHTDEMIEEVAEIIEPETPSVEIYDHAGDIYFMNGDHAQAIVFWKKALALEPDNETIKLKVKNKRINETQ